jgi:hypothetical protein
VPRPRPKPGARATSSAHHSPDTPTEEPAPRLVRPFIDDFERNRIGRNYRATSSGWTVKNGRLCGIEARNHPIWLRRRLPERVRIEFDALSGSQDGDIKAEVFGDGRSYARGTSYDDATGYLLIYGGWKNSRHVLARLDEHGADRLTLFTAPGDTSARVAPVVPGRSYHFEIERLDDRTLKWSVDGEEIHSLRDEQPLRGHGHEYFAFNCWRARVCFDNLKVVPLGI